ncbi:MAG: hypothetical protein ABJC12_04160 [Saprospiraceae bacterium]
MKRKTVFILLAGFVLIAIMLKLSATLFVEPLIRKTIESSFNKENVSYNIDVRRDRIHFFPLGINLENVRFFEHVPDSDSTVLAGEFPSIFFNGFHLLKAIFSHQLIFQQLNIEKGSFSGRILHPQKSLHAFGLPFSLDIREINIDSLDFNLMDSTSTKLYSLSQGKLRAKDFKVLKGDVLAHFTISNFDFSSPEILFHTPDSLYSFKADSIRYSTQTETLFIPHFQVHPNYKGYDFTSRKRYQTDRIEAVFSDITLNNFCAEDLLREDRFNASYCEIGKLDLDVFRDRRKEYLHVTKPIFQDIFYKIPVTINLDSVNLFNGNIVYTEHAENANHPGTISFSKAKASLYNITNDSIHYNSNDTLKLIADAFVSGKGKLHILARGKVFDSKNTFVMNGSLSSMAARDLNHILNHNAFIYAYGKINALNFGFTANNSGANGKVLFLYDDLAIRFKNKTTDDTTGLKERLLTKIANKKILDANPIKGEASRIGIIEYERDPEKTFFNYCLKAIFSGIKSSTMKSSTNKKG